ncbi:MAG: WG repeat-containing protein [Chitinophagaceae bacterium]|nr:MAG: WG repeat-containing protein [Chitinophagaceae bacterium]
MKCIVWVLLFTIAFVDCTAQDLLPFKSDALWGYRDKQGEVKIEPQFQYASKFKFGNAVVAKNGRFGAIDENNHLLIPFRYEYLQPLDTAEFLFGYRAKYFGEHIVGVITREEKIKIPAEYHYISKYKGRYTVEKTSDSVLGKNAVGDVRSIRSFEGLLDTSGQVLIPCLYHHVEWLNDSLFKVDSLVASASGGWIPNQALFSGKGKQLTGFDYMAIGKFVEGLAEARIGDKCGYIYPNGKVAIPFAYELCENFNQGYAIIRQNGKWGAIGKSGKFVIEPKFSYQEVKANLNEKDGR